MNGVVWEVTAGITEIAEIASIIGAVSAIVTLIAFWIALQERSEAREERLSAAKAREALAESDRKRFDLISSYQEHLEQLFRESGQGESDAESRAADQIADTGGDVSFKSQPDQYFERVSSEIPLQDGRSVRPSFSRRWIRPGPLTLIVGTESDGLWKLTRRQDKHLEVRGFNAEKFVDVDKPLVVEEGEASEWVRDSLSKHLNELDPPILDVIRRRERGSPLAVVRTSDGRWFKVTKSNFHPGSSKVEELNP